HLCYLISRGLKTFPLRMREHNRSTLAIATWLEKHPKIEKVWYPLLPSHPDYALAQKYLSGGGGVVSFCIKAEDVSQKTRMTLANTFLNRLKIPTIAASLGGVESLIHHVAIMSYADLTPEKREEIGIPDNLIRFAVGLEDTDDLIADLTQALG
ncbi:MAG TPA: PLP-dependent transferase, partial [Turneriella sp.]|nr:PLP-dependent transferase [Turneriella sp.]